MKRFLAFVLAGLSPIFLNAADCIDNAPWTKILRENVTSEGLVDYEGLRLKSRSDVDRYITSLETADLKSCSETARLAFWINAYNANMIRLVLERPMLKKISDDFPLFDEKFPVAGRSFSLNEIENRILRSDPAKGGGVDGISISKRDPRVHFALVCGAIDCPKLITKAYVEADLNSTLQNNAVQFANNPKHVSIQNGKLTVSSILKWYENDFANVGGVATYLASLTDVTLRKDADTVNERLKKDFPGRTTFKYDWSLNTANVRKEK